MKKSILDQYNELLFEHDYPELNSLVDFFGVDIRVHSKDEYDYLARMKNSFIHDVEDFYSSFYLYETKEKKSSISRRYPTLYKNFWDEMYDRLEGMNELISDKLLKINLKTILFNMQATL